MTAKKLFRCLLIAIVVSFIASACAYHFEKDTFPKELKDYQNTRSIEVFSSHYAVFATESLAYAICFIVSMVGLYFFWRPARIFYCGSLVVGILMAVDPAYQFQITPKWEGVFESCGVVLSGVILGVMFTSPIRELFTNKATPKPSNRTQHKGVSPA